MRVDAVATALGILRSLVKRWIAEGKLRSTKIGALRRVYADSVIEFLKSGEGGGR